ncbi:MAG: dGTP triphosphohydrolase [Planctomycetota bacterium]
MGNDNELAAYALNPVERKKELGDNFREHEKEERKDEFRRAYHRDRDRIIWSTAFRRMQNKTQVFAHDDDDHFRRRLTHSIEVAGIACSIARKLKLNEVATDAIALGHDIGHAPFGHAGEEALNKIFKEYKFPSRVKQPVPLKGFDHCAHAIEVVSRIETLNGVYSGLGLTFDIRDGILKHIYHTDESTRTKKQLEERPFSVLSEIVKCKEYEEYKCNYGSLEAQCVWFADKLTYLFDDLEDAIRAKIFRFDIRKLRKMREKLIAMAKKLGANKGSSETNHKFIREVMEPLECDILKNVRCSHLDKALSEKFKKLYGDEGIKNLYKRSDTIHKNHPDDDVRQFLFWRNKTMTVMIEDCIEATTKRIVDKPIKTVKDVFECKQRLVDVSEDLRKAWREDKDDNFYKKTMIENLFKQRIILKHAYNARKKIHRLFKIYHSEEGYELVPDDYKRITKENYRSCNFGVTDDNDREAVMKVITIRNYIAGMTDAYVNQKLDEYAT